MPRVNSAGNMVKVVVVALVLLALAGAGFWWLKIHDFHLGLAFDDGLNALRSAGPLAFFAAMAVLPALGCPILAFYLTAGPAFTERMWLAGVIAATGVALLINLSLSYWLACYALRPTLERMISRTKYRIPQLTAADHAEITVLLRITPGPPYFVQSYLLGLAAVRFRTYLWISWVISIAYASGFIVFGDAILHGKARLALLGISVLVAMALIVHFLRRHYGKKRP